MRVPSGIDRQLHEGAHCTVHTSRECQAQAGLPGSFMLIICEDEGGGIQTPPLSTPLSYCDRNHATVAPHTLLLFSQEEMRFRLQIQGEGGGAIQGRGDFWDLQPYILPGILWFYSQHMRLAALLTSRSTMVLFTKHEICSLTYSPEYYGSIHKTWD